jgi:DSBA-like thioredoxin domain
MGMRHGTCSYPQGANRGSGTVGHGEGPFTAILDDPIDQLHPGACKAHEAARCASETGKVWAYHDVLFANAPQASPEQLKAYAQHVELDVAAFEPCFTSGTDQTAVPQDIEEGARAGATGTRAFFINGRLVSGTQPLERFARDRGRAGTGAVSLHARACRVLVTRNGPGALLDSPHRAPVLHADGQSSSEYLP